MIDFSDVSKSYGEQIILRNASFRINSGERVGMVGPNGAGKSTIFSIIAGELTPDSGTVALPKNLFLSVLKQQLPGHEQLGRTLLDFTADARREYTLHSAELHRIEDRLAKEDFVDPAERDRLLKHSGELQSSLEQLGFYHIRAEAEAALCELGFEPDALNNPLSSFSGGWQMRASLARLLIGQPDVLMLDEPSNYLDIPAVEYLCRSLRGFRGTLILISHDRYLLRKLTTLTLEINGGEVTRYAGNYDYYVRERAERRRLREAAAANIDRKREQLQRGIDRFRAKSSKAAQAKSWQKALDRMESVDLPDSLAYHGAIRLPQPPPCGTEAARLENVSFGYLPEKKIIRNFSLDIAAGDRLAFVGFNGMGKSTLLKLIAGALNPDGGRVVIGHNIVMGYQAQEFSELLPPEMSVYDVARAAMGRDFAINNLLNVLAAFGFAGDDVSKPCKVLSGGEKIRLCFARIFVNPPNFLLLDEPTTHLDVDAREHLQQALNQFRGTFCIVSHDIDFVRGTATAIIGMEHDGIRKYYGNYDYYLEKREEFTAANSTAATSGGAASSVKSVENERTGVAAATGASSKERRRERARQRAELAASRKGVEQRVAKAEQDIARLEKKQNELASQMSSELVDFAAVNRELHSVQQQLERANEAWEKAAMALEAFDKEHVAERDDA